MNTPNTILTVAGMVLLASAAPVLGQVLPEVESRRCSAENRGDCLNGVGSGVTSLDGLRVSGVPASRHGSEGAADEQRQAMLPGGEVHGMSAGSGALAGYNVWSSYGYSRFESDTRLGAYRGHTENLLVGVDRLLGERLLLGVSLGYESTDNTTTFNNGEQDREGVTIAPYALVLLSDAFSIDVSAGYGRLYTDQDRINTGTGTRITSDFDAERAFATANLNGLLLSGDWVLGGRLGVLYAVESQDAYLETDATVGAGSQARAVRDRHIDLTQGYASVDAAYAMGEWEPYATVGYHRDFSRDDGRTAGGLPGGVVTQPNDRTEWQYGVGLRYYGSGVSGSLEWITTQGRKAFDNDALNLSVRVDF